MSELFRNTLSLWQWSLLALIPLAIIALYFLKLKRMPLEVPSTYLWKRTIEDLHVNSLWQRLRKSLLLFLQLLLVALAMLALVRPGWLGSRLEGQRFILLIDNSASMSATDGEHGASRLEEAKRTAAHLIDQMDSSMSAMIISFSDTPQVVQGFTSNRRQLAEALTSIQPTSRATDLAGALDLARSLSAAGLVESDEAVARPKPAATEDTSLYIFSDGRFDDIKDFSLGKLQPVYVPIGSLDSDNLAITAFNTRQSELLPESQQAFVQLTNFTYEPQTAIVELALDGQFLDAQNVSVPADESAAVVFTLSGVTPGSLSARLKRTGASQAVHDVLAGDDVAYAALNDPAPGRVLVVTPGNAALEAAFKTAPARQMADVKFALPGILDSDEYRRESDGGMIDLIVYDQCAPDTMPRTNTLFIGQLPPGSTWGRTANAAGTSPETQPQPTAAEPTIARVQWPQIIDWDRGHPLLAHVELDNVDVASSLVLRVPPGGDLLIDSTDGPIAAIAPRDGFEDVVLGFAILDEDTSVRGAQYELAPAAKLSHFLAQRALEYLAGGEEATAQVRPGQPVKLEAAGNADEITVVDPTSHESTLRRSDQQRFQFHDTFRPGVYQVRQDGRTVERFAVNLFDQAESDVRLRPSRDDTEGTATAADIRIGHVDVAASSGQVPARQELWKAILAAALVVLMVEWYIYNRRVYL